MSNESEIETRKSIISYCLLMNSLGINQGMSGNISVRHGEGLLITPTSIPYDQIEVDDIVYLAPDGRPTGRRQPSSEWRFHRDIMLARTDVNAIVHAHPPYCAILSIMHKPIPPIHYMVAVAGGHDIRCAPYAIFGSEELSNNAVEALKDRRACLLAHHGLIAVGSNLEKAMWLSVEVETLARQYHGCLQLGEPPLLTVQQIQDVSAKMAGYGHSE